jgi:hypothetical protein
MRGFFYIYIELKIAIKVSNGVKNQRNGYFCLTEKTNYNFEFI